MARKKSRREPPLHTPRLQGEHEEVRRSHQRAIEDLRQRVRELERGEQRYPDWAMCAIAADDTSVASGSHIEFDTITQPTYSKIFLNTGSGQNDGIITIRQGVTYLIQTFVFTLANEGYVRYRLYDHDTGAALTGDTGVDASNDAFSGDPVTLDAGHINDAVLITPAQDIRFKVESIGSSNAISVYEGSRVWIQEILRNDA